jgi:TRAP-type C4-dicarboxylate transport system substrate-binding protein
MSITRRTFGGIALAAAAVRPASAQTAWNMPTPYPDGNFHTQNVRQFVQDVRNATNGQLVINVHSAGSLFPHAQIRRNVRQGLAQVGELLISLHANESPIYGLDSVPFLATSYAEARRLYAAHKPALERRLAEEGLVLLYSVAWPPQGVYAKKQLNSVEDLRGLRFRTYNPGTARIAQLAGATPVQVEVPDLPTAFATGRVESTITSAATGVDSRFWEFVSHYHDTQAWLPRNMVFANKAAFDGLPQAQKDALTTASRAAEERGWAASERETGERMQTLRQNGMTIISPAPAQLMEGLRGFGRTIAAEWEQAAGAEGAAILRAYRG